MQDHKKKILDKLFAERKIKLEPIIIEILSRGVEKDLMMNDFPYIEARAKQVVEEMINNINFDNPEVQKARLEFLKVCWENGKKAKPYPKQIRKRRPNLTEQRDNRCESVVHEVIMDLLDPEVALSDSEYIGEAVKDQNMLLFQVIFYGYLDTLFSQLDLILNGHLANANRFLWKGKEKEQISMRDVDEVLKDNKPKE